MLIPPILISRCLLNKYVCFFVIIFSGYEGCESSVGVAPICSSSARDRSFNYFYEEGVELIFGLVGSIFPRSIFASIFSG